jgi:hypothetical protein
MSTTKAEKYGRQARNCDTVEDVGDCLKSAIEELVDAIREKATPWGAPKRPLLLRKPPPGIA